jgi:hypothetical protein
MHGFGKSTLASDDTKAEIVVEIRRDNKLRHVVRYIFSIKINLEKLN